MVVLLFSIFTTKVASAFQRVSPGFGIQKRKTSINLYLRTQYEEILRPDRVFPPLHTQKNRTKVVLRIFKNRTLVLFLKFWNRTKNRYFVRLTFKKIGLKCFLNMKHMGIWIFKKKSPEGPSHPSLLTSGLLSSLAFLFFILRNKTKKRRLRRISIFQFFFSQNPGFRYGVFPNLLRIEPKIGILGDWFLKIKL